jgi:hypothetical protein
VTVLVLYAFLAAIAAIVLFALFVFVLPKGEQMAVAVPDSAPWTLPGSVRADDIVSLRLPVGLRGYRFAEADVLLDRLADELRRRDAEIAWLRGGRIGPDPSLIEAAPVVVPPTGDPWSVAAPVPPAAAAPTPVLPGSNDPSITQELPAIAAPSPPPAPTDG